eukprot:CCRYP_001403-RB/>CCRYP_001403-RB protein AED:0.40 eAED:0.64 QI:0/0/0/1/0/0/3/0/379
MKKQISEQLSRTTAHTRAIVKDNYTHLSNPEQAKLLELLQEFEELFSWKLGDWDCKPVSLQLKEGAQPCHGRPFPIPKKHVETTKREVQRLCDLGVLKLKDDSEWASPTFIIPKNDNIIWVVSNFREVNKRVVRKPFPIPKISTVLQELEGFTYATALDLNMVYYTTRLDPDASKICTIIFPRGKYSSLLLSMGRDRTRATGHSRNLKEFKGMIWGQQITVYTGHKNLMQDALGLTSDRVYRWRFLLEEYGPTVVYIKGIHNTDADAISRLDYGPQETSPSNTKESMNQVFANRNEEDSIYPLTTREIAETQQADHSLHNKGYSTQLVENTNVLCKDGKMVIPKSLQHRALAWFHHYLQHPGTKRLKETLRLLMYWKGI